MVCTLPQLVGPPEGGICFQEDNEDNRGELLSTGYLSAFGHPNGDSREQNCMLVDGIGSTEMDTLEVEILERTVKKTSVREKLQQRLGWVVAQRPKDCLVCVTHVSHIDLWYPQTKEFLEIFRKN